VEGYILAGSKSLFLLAIESASIALTAPPTITAPTTDLPIHTDCTYKADRTDNTKAASTALPAPTRPTAPTLWCMWHR
jgi:hypothetical protein